MSIRSANEKSHIISNKMRLIARVKKMQGQLKSVEQALDSDEDCKKILHTLASVRGALTGLMCEVIESHILEHMSEENRELSKHELQLANELSVSLKTFL
ncbi:metal/formaldehyde-sensitive transcriptional repressor [Pigmentibacter sp. JX0631]|uniref:metal/formaldehyde-sensitive transcriptional repressor n=1 Tax=Pigmentibacter sp. JX0631 TaxID=2976982 RepID=UPI00246845EA|nr:metal/formaldehyde-sensitive transcriptional repressor [Pigmentibacter sp. JX0631]WGL59121.1 metal/formaldehyde-sensitive transcriptional repressor [Pigmentibacter sp. JX0631]